MKHLIVIEGPTASGKTSLSIALAKELNTCILSADSRQFYKELSIGTAKPSKEEQDGVLHYFIDSHSIHDELTSAQYEQEALEVLEEAFKQRDTIILVGGSGMFIDALCNGLDPIPASPKVKAEVQKEFDEEGLDHLLQELKEKDPEYFKEVDTQNPMRVMRAIEVIRLTGEPYSSQRKSTPQNRPFKVHRYVIDHEREVLYERINLRVDQMIENGLIEEAQSVREFRHLSSLNTVGYKELFDHFEGNTSLDEAIELIKRNTRRYAKRQLTWFRRHKEAVWINFSSSAEMQKEIVEDFKHKLQIMNNL